MRMVTLSFQSQIEPALGNPVTPILILHLQTLLWMIYQMLSESTVTFVSEISNGTDYPYLHDKTNFHINVYVMQHMP